MKKKFLLLCVLLFLMLCSGSVGFAVWNHLRSPAIETDTLEQYQLFTLKRGTSLRGVAAQLKHQNLIRSEWAAYWYLRLSGITVQAGTYKLSPAMPLETLCTHLSSGKQEYIKVTVPEGMTISKVAALLERSEIVQEQLFLTAAHNTDILKEFHISGKSAEGFLYPDTYFFTHNETAESVLRVFLTTFFEKIATIPNVPKTEKDLYNMVILASIVEREYRLPDEAAKIAGVFVNRLSINMGLESCATVEYVITEIQKKPHPTRLLNHDLKIDNLYNTYKWNGLPPGPISSPGMTALHAACNPEKHDYLFFRLENAERGNHIFTKNLNDHVKAGALIIKKAAGH